MSVSIPLRLVMLLGGLLLARPDAASAQSRESAVSDSLVVYSARVRIVAPALGSGWHTGVVGRLGRCLAVFVPAGASPQAATEYKPVHFRSISRLRVSNRYDGRPTAGGKRRMYVVGADTVGERWIDVSTDQLRARYGACQPF